MKTAKCFKYKFASTAWLLFFLSSSALAQNPYQQPQTFSNTPSQPSGNFVEKLFANPNAANTGFNASPDTNNPYASMGGVPSFPSNFWGGVFNRKIIDAGTVLNGTLVDELSSKKSKIGDTFSILLGDGYVQNNVQLIPANSKIVGAINAVTPASTTTNGVAGSLQVSLQTLVMPDGRSMPISASIMYNPNQPSPIDTKKGRGIPVGEYAHQIGYSVVYAAGALTHQFGIPMPVKTQTGHGPDFDIQQGQLVPVKLTQPLDMTAYATNLPPPSQAPNMVQGPMANPSSNPSPGFNSTAPNSWAPNNPTYPGAWQNNQPTVPMTAPPLSNPSAWPTTPSSPISTPSTWPTQPVVPAPTGTNILPGNNDPAGPDPF